MSDSETSPGRDPDVDSYDAQAASERSGRGRPRSQSSVRIPHSALRAPSARFSILIPCRQHGGLLPEAVGSALAQTGGELEIIIIDDGSTDQTREVGEAFAREHPGRVHYFYQSHAGQQAARQRGLDAATGEFCLMLDADDLLEPGAVEACLRVFEAHPEADAVVGNALLVGPDGRQVLATHTQTTIVPWPEILRRNPYGVNLGVMMRMRSLRAAGGLAFSHAGCEDWDVWCRMARCGMTFAATEAVLGRYRQTGWNHSRNVLNNLLAYLELLEVAAHEDPRLAGFGGAIASPISVDRQQHYRNGRVFHALGLALGWGADAKDWTAIIEKITSGMLDPAGCIEQFTEGLRFAWGEGSGNKAKIPLGRVLGRVRRGLITKKQPRAVQEEIGAGLIHAVRQVTGRRSIYYFALRLREVLRHG